MVDLLSPLSTGRFARTGLDYLSSDVVVRHPVRPPPYTHLNPPYFPQRSILPLLDSSQGGTALVLNERMVIFKCLLSLFLAPIPTLFHDNTAKSRVLNNHLSEFKVLPPFMVGTDQCQWQGREGVSDQTSPGGGNTRSVYPAQPTGPLVD